MPRRPKWGQHFLRDESTLERIAASAATENDAVVEVGPGQGALTRHLLPVARRVVAVEVDADLARELPGRCGNAPNLNVLNADILEINLLEITRKYEDAQWVVSGNLPYYITSPILRAVFSTHRLFRAATFLVQDEVADRIAAREGSRSYGYLSCLCQLYCIPSKLFSVPPEAFAPIPRVRSAVVRLEMIQEDPPDGLLEFLGACFRSPRKTLRNNLRGLFPIKLVASDKCAGLRAEQLSLADLKALWRRLESGR
ncbi:MAG: 16S rRNA (adenine(1518)-N(6)/adenine(1519)-N(6))-dimethyltransferase RsmA [Bryobacterales bacterium]|nr:16S rRNA (adenine(1518)-N(6)/adenine(1519)-N(6))-dimethyltransferase RsmA [Bryobacterales bacterium]